MSLIKFYDRVQYTVALSGTGTVNLASAEASPRFQEFPGGGSFGTFIFAIVDETTGDYEIGEYEEDGFGNLPRSGSQTVLASSNSNNEVNFSAGDKKVMMVTPAYLFNLLNYDNSSTAPAFLLGSNFEKSNGSYELIAHSDATNPNAFVFGAMGPNRCHQQTQVSRVRTTDATQTTLFTIPTISFNGGDADSSHGIVHIKAIVTATGSVSSGTTYEGRADEVECVVLYRGNTGSSAYIVNTVTAIGSDGTAAGSWAVASNDTAPGFTIQVTGDANSEIDWVAEVHMVANGRTPAAEI